MNAKAKQITLYLLLLSPVTAMAQAWEYVNLRQYRVKDPDLLKAFIKQAYPIFNKSKRAPVVNRVAATSESGRIYAATYFATMDQFSAFVKEFNTDFEEYSKTAGSLAQNQLDNLEGGYDDVLWKLDKDMTYIPPTVDPAKLAWRKLHFVTVKQGMMADYIATRKRIIEIEKQIGVEQATYVLTAAYGAPSNMILVSGLAASAVDYYTSAAARQKIRDGNPEILALRKKLTTLTSNTLVDQITMIPY